MIKKNLFNLSFSVVLLMLGSTYFTTFLTLKLHALDVKEWMIGCVHTAFSIGFIIGTLYVHPFILWFNHRRSFFIFTIGLALAVFCNLFVFTLPTIMVLRLISGVSLAALYVIIESLYLMISPLEKRGQILSIYMIALYAAQSVSQFFHHLIPLNSDSIFWILSLIMLLSCLPMKIFHLPPADTPSLSLKSVLKQKSISSLGLHVSFASGFILTSLYSFLPLLAYKIQLSVAFIMSGLILGGLSSQWPTGLVLDRYPKKRVLVILSLLTLGACAILSQMSLQASTQYVMILLLGAFSFSFYPLAIGEVCENQPQETLTGLTAVVMLLYSFGMVLGPSTTPLFNQLLGPYGLIYQVGLSAFLMGIHALFILLKTGKTDPQASANQQFKRND